MRASGETKSPCRRVCSLNSDDICIGCYRTSKEIGDWQVMDDRQREIIIRRCKEREKNGSIL